MFHISRTTHTITNSTHLKPEPWGRKGRFNSVQRLDQRESAPSLNTNHSNRPSQHGWLHDFTILPLWAGGVHDQLCPQQFKYITCRRESSACLTVLSSPPLEATNPSISVLSAPDKGRRSVASPPEEKKRFLPWLRDLRPDFSFCPWSEWLLTTATLAAIHALFK